MDTPDINPGLEGIVVAETSLSSIDGKRGALIIGGFPIGELAPNATYEESAYLLLNGRLPTETELRRFRETLARRRCISSEVEGVLHRAANEKQSTMDALRMGLSAASLRPDTDGIGTNGTRGGPDGSAQVEDDARRVIAVIPTIIATYWRFRQEKPVVSPRDDLGHAANYLYMLSGDEPEAAHVRGMETYLNTVIDHGLNASTFTARTIVSTESDLISAATAAIGALKGPLHGGAPGPVLDMLTDVHKNGDPEARVRKKLEAGDRLMGFGHRVYRARDPRAAVLSSAAERLYAQSGDEDFFETARELETIGTRLLAEHKPDRRLKINVEFYTAVLLHGLGIPQALFTATFAASRAGGWMAHALEQKRNNRLVRPVSRYSGDTGRTWTPLEKRKH